MIDRRLKKKVKQYDTIKKNVVHVSITVVLFNGSLDSSVGLQLTFVNRIAGQEDYEKSIAIPPQGDSFDDVRPIKAV